MIDAAAIRRREVFSAGAVRAPEFAVFPGGGVRHTWLPCLFAMIEHRTEGIGLFDTGHARRFFGAASAWPYSLYRRATHVRIEAKDEAVNQLKSLGVTPGEVRWVVISHFDPDHIGGLLDFPLARILCSRSALRSVEGKRGIAALQARFLPALFPKDLGRRVEMLPAPTGPAIGPFGASHDLFGDGGIRLVDLPGHAAGQVGAFVRGPDGVEWLLAADACWTRGSISPRGRRRPAVNAHRIIAVDRTEQDRTYDVLRELRRRLPEVVVIPSHCTEAAAELVPRHAWRAAT